MPLTLDIIIVVLYYGVLAMSPLPSLKSVCACMMGKVRHASIELRVDGEKVPAAHDPADQPHFGDDEHGLSLAKPGVVRPRGFHHNASSCELIDWLVDQDDRMCIAD